MAILPRREQRTNWAGNLTYSTDLLYEPNAIEEAQTIIRSLPHIRPIGSRHCFNPIADTNTAHLSLAQFQDIDIDAAAMTVTVGAGVRYGDLAPMLHQNGFALHNLASLPHISVVGACATGTHGSGIDNGSLATAVTGMRFIDAAGTLHTLSSDAPTFLGAVIHLGALGVVTDIKLRIEPMYEMAQRLYLDLPITVMDDHFDEIMSAGYSVSLFTDWQEDTINQVWIKDRVDAGNELALRGDFFGARPATTKLHPISTADPTCCTDQLGAPGPWYERLPHFRMDFTPSSGVELQTEYFVARQDAPAVFRRLSALRARFADVLMISEIRTIAADDLWMSMAYQRESVGFHFTWEQDWPAVSALLPIIEAELAPFNPRPHWGKNFIQAPIYPDQEAFCSLVAAYDPNGKFRNRFLEQWIHGATSY